MSEKRYVIVTTEKKGVFFGEMVSQDGDTCVLADAQMAVYWPAENKGVVGLTVSGPKCGARITQKAPTATLFGITAIMDCTPEAAEAWRAAPWT